MTGRISRLTSGSCRWLGVSLLVATLSAQPLEPDRVATVIEALTRLGPEKVNANPALKEALGKVLQATQGKPQFVELVRDFGIKDQHPALLDIAIKNSNNSTGVEAVRVIVGNHDFDLLKGSLNGTNALKVVEVLGNTGDKHLVPLLEPLVTDLNRDLKLRQQAVRSLAQTQNGAAALLELAREDKLPQDVRFTAAGELNQARWQHVKEEAAKLLPLPQGRDAQALPPVAELQKMSGQAAKGAEVFRRDTVGCIKCHQIAGEGTDVGPSLSEIGTKLGKDALYESILDPSAGISFGYEAWQIELKDGDEVYGLIVSETAEDLVVKTQSGIVTKYKKSDIAKREKQKLSIMPAGLQQAMTTQDLVDLVEYLSSLKKASN
jgi:putative heme-binding domain-containing protein